MIALALILSCGLCTVEPPRNIIVILADDMGLASLHAEHPASGLPTPNLDRLRSQGMSFTDAHSTSAVCSPTRYGLLTGRYSWRTTMKSGIVAKWGTPLIAEDRATLADLAHGAGRRTACIGKWHLGWRWPRNDANEIDYTQPIGGGALEAGFDHYFGDDVPNWPPYVWIEDNRALGMPSVTMQEDNANGVRKGPAMEGWSLEAVLPELTRRCVGFIKECAEADEPFFLYFPMTSPHTPISPSETFLGQSGVSKYADFILETDWSVGQLLRALDQFGVAEDTLVIFTSDNGTSPKCSFETLAKGGVDLRGTWRGHKADVWEGGHRVPFLARWPGVIEPNSTCAEPIGLTDLFATLEDALGIDLEGGEDSLSLMPLFTNPTRDAPMHAALINHSSNGQFAIRQGKWKLCFCPGSGGWSSPRGVAQATKLGIPLIQLYDLDVDPSEENNLAESMPEMVNHLTAAFRATIEAHPNDGPQWWKQLPWSNE